MANAANKVSLIGIITNVSHCGKTTHGTDELRLEVRTGLTSMKEKCSDYPDTGSHQVVVIGKLNGLNMKPLKKGAQVSVEGRLDTLRWGYNGGALFLTRVVAEKLILLGQDHLHAHMAHNA